MKVTLEEVTKRFGNLIANDKVSLEIKSGEFFILLGPSGCGKTTLMRSIAGLETSDSGSIYIGDEKVNDLPPKDRNIGLVFQNLALYPHMDGFNNIAFPLRVQGMSDDEIRERVEEVAELVRASDLLDRPPRKLSGGEQQRIALARTLARNPGVFLMDEPLANLDAKLRIYMRSELQRIHRKLGTTIIYVTHDQEEAMSMGDRIAVMREGAILQVGTPKELYNTPTNLFVGGFIGSPPMGMLEGRLQEENNGWIISSEEFTMPISEELGEYLNKEANSASIIIGLRPEDLSLSKEKTRGDKAIRGKIEVIEPKGSDLYVDVILENTTLTVRTDPTQELKIGEEVLLQWTEKQAYFFDKQSENLLCGRGVKIG